MAIKFEILKNKFLPVLLAAQMVMVPMASKATENVSPQEQAGRKQISDQYEKFKTSYLEHLRRKYADLIQKVESIPRDKLEQLFANIAQGRDVPEMTELTKLQSEIQLNRETQLVFIDYLKSTLEHSKDAPNIYRWLIAAGFSYGFISVVSANIKGLTEDARYIDTAIARGSSGLWPSGSGAEEAWFRHAKARRVEIAGIIPKSRNARIIGASVAAYSIYKLGENILKLNDYFDSQRDKDLTEQLTAAVNLKWNTESDLLAREAFMRSLGLPSVKATIGSGAK